LSKGTGAIKFSEAADGEIIETAATAELAGNKSSISVGVEITTSCISTGVGISSAIQATLLVDA
jgi:hypothetical protein